MQKCLHSCRRKKLKTKVLAAFASILGIITAVNGVNPINTTETKHKYAASKYISVSDEAANNFETDVYGQDNIYKKMNNETEKNSKYGIFLPSTHRELQTDGTVNVLFDDGKVMEMPLEDYVYGCLIGEMPLTFHTQALMAQSVAIRSFTLNKVLYASKHKNADICTNPACCQKYINPRSSGYDESLLSCARQCVNATEGIVAVWEGSPINAVYHASSSVTTKDSKDVWGGEVAYLKSVDSPKGEKEIYDFYYSGKGGHGVGMSQQGANLLAKEGKSYAEILRHYYSGIYLDSIEY